MEAYVIQWKWGTSRGRDTYGYTTCSCWVDGKRLGSCSGGGYDLKGSAFAEAMMRVFPKELLAIAKKADLQYTVSQAEDGTKKTTRSDRKGPLYGMIAIFSEKGKPTSVALDGACGLESMVKIVEALGYKLERVTSDLAKLEKIKA